jgi:GTP-binding protein
MDKQIRNVAVIAHVDHGKTTLVDAMLKQSHVFRDNEAEMGQEQILDRNELERERGITILAKNCAINYKDTKINIIDTPGHADFSGEVERTLGMADAALLIVDAQEGPMPQTRFVLKKALELGLKIIVVVNKIDKQFADPAEALDKVESLFLELAKNDSHLEFKTLYAIGRRGVVWNALPANIEDGGDVLPLLDAICEYVPAAEKLEGTFKMVITSLESDSHLGQIVIGKVHQGTVKKGMKVVLSEEPTKFFTVEKLMVYDGLGKVEVEEAGSGEIVAFSGISKVKIGSTVADPSDVTSLPYVAVGEPTLHMSLGPNTSPMAGREGKFVTGRQIEERLDRELEKNLSLRVEMQGNGKFTVSGRGELHLSILLETMRREGFEMEVGKPEVITKEIEGVLSEPQEEVSIIVPSEFVGVITEEFGKRYGALLNMEPTAEGDVEFVYHIPTRALIGLRSYLLTATKGTVIFNSNIIGFGKVGKELPKMRRGALIASQPGEALGYGLANAQERGVLFINPGEEVYEGMIVGINAKDEDISVNVCKGKKLTNMRSKSSDGVLQLAPATKLSLEQSLDFLENDELLEITPSALRLRKKHLTELERKRNRG